MQDLRWSLRSLRKSPGFTALAVGTLTIGIAAATVAFAVLDATLLRPLPYRDAGRLVFIRERTAKQELIAPSYPNFVSWRENARSFESVASATRLGARFVWPDANDGEPVHATMLGISRHFLATLGVSPSIGREFTDDEESPGGPQALMVSYEFWRTQMGGRLPLGTLGAGERYPVVGVMPPGFQFMQPADVFYPHEHYPDNQRNASNYTVIARLTPGVALGAARANMTALSKSLLAEFGNGTQAVDADVVPLRDYLVANYRTMPPIVFGAAALVLLIACTNLVSAQLARGRVREREVVVRAALGASRSRLIRQLLTESLVIAAAGAALASLVSVFAIRAIAAEGAAIMPRLASLEMDTRVLAFAIVVAAVATLAVGVYPALRLANRDAGLVLRGSRTSSLAVRAPVWRVLIGFEVALAIVLATASAMLIETFHNIMTADSGFDPNGILTVTATAKSGELAQYDRLLAGIRALPGVTGAAYTTRAPLAWETMSSPVRRPGDPPDHDWPAMAGFRVISPEYFSVLRQPVLRGRAFTDADREGSIPVAIITPGIAAKLWPGEDPVGKSISSNIIFDQWLTVVGVVSEASTWTAPRGAQNEIYVPLAQHAKQAEGPVVAMVRISNAEGSIVAPIRALMRTILPGTPALYGRMEERIARSAADRRFAMLALTGFGAIALLLAAIGIYGVISYIVTTRTQEIGIRMALGASAHTVRIDVMRGAALTALGGIAAGVAGALFATRYLESLLYGVSHSGSNRVRRRRGDRHGHGARGCIRARMAVEPR